MLPVLSFAACRFSLYLNTIESDLGLGVMKRLKTQQALLVLICVRQDLLHRSSLVHSPYTHVTYTVTSAAHGAQPHTNINTLLGHEGPYIRPSHPYDTNSHFSVEVKGLVCLNFQTPQFVTGYCSITDGRVILVTPRRSVQET